MGNKNEQALDIITGTYLTVRLILSRLTACSLVIPVADSSVFIAHTSNVPHSKLDSK